MELSIIIPHFNSPRLLENLLKSMPAREDIQIIVIDDNSTEDRRSISNSLRMVHTPMFYF